MRSRKCRLARGGRPQDQDTARDRRALHQPRRNGRLLETNEIDVLQPDIIHVGGILEGKKIAAIADAYYIPVSFHNPFGPVATAAAVQLDACTTNFVMQESFCEYDVDFRFDLLEHAPRPEDGHYDIPDRPGLGVGEFRPEVALAHPFEPDAFLPLFTDRWSGPLLVRHKRRSGLSPQIRVFSLDCEEAEDLLLQPEAVVFRK